MDRLMKKLGLLALCTGLSFAVHAVTPQAEAPAEQNVKIDSVVVTGARYASGFEKEEIEQLKAVGGKTMSLGKRILRTETAGMTVLSILMFTIEE